MKDMEFSDKDLELMQTHFELQLKEAENKVQEIKNLIQKLKSGRIENAKKLPRGEGWKAKVIKDLPKRRRSNN